MLAKILAILPYQRRSLPTLIAFLSVVGIFEAIRSAFFWNYLPYVRQDLGLTAAEIGLAYTLNVLSETFTKTLGGFLVQRIGLGLVAVLAAVAVSVCIYLTPHVSNSLSLFGLVMAWGVLYSGLGPGIMTYVSRVAIQGREGRALAYAGMSAAPWVGLGLIGGNLLVRHNVQDTHSGLMILSFLAIGLSFLLFRYRDPKFASGLLQENHPWQKLMLFLPAAFAQMFAPALISQIFLKYADKELKLSVFQVGCLLTVAAITNFVGTGVFGRIADRQGSRVPLIFGILLMGLAFILVAIRPTFWWLVLVAFIAGMGNSMFIPSWNAMVVKLLPVQNRAAVWGTLMTVEGLGNALGPAAGGLLTTTIGTTAPFFAGAVTFGFIAIFYLLTLFKQGFSK